MRGLTRGQMRAGLPHRPDTTPARCPERDSVPAAGAVSSAHRPPSASIRSRSRGHASANAGSRGRSVDLVERDPAQLDALRVGDGGVDREDLVGEHRRVATSRGAGAPATRAAGHAWRSMPASSAASRSAASSAVSPGIRAPPGTPHVPPWSLQSARCWRTTRRGRRRRPAARAAARRRRAGPSAAGRRRTPPSRRRGGGGAVVGRVGASADDLADGGAGAHARPDARGQRRSRCRRGARRAAAPSSSPRARRRGRPRPPARPRPRRP